MSRKRIIVTGASGFIGGQTMLHLHDQGYKVIGVDIRPLPDHLRGAADIFLHEDFSSRYILDMISREGADAIVHCAATSLVGPSVTNPELYYSNNMVKNKTLLDHLVKHSGRTRLIISSSSSVYGEPQRLPLQETDMPAPVSPYGESKRMTEMMLASYNRAYELDFVALRYFNVCGADPQTRHGQAPGATHIIARILESIRDDREFVLNGCDYPTPDGTCVRDHVHVSDVAQLHQHAVDRKFQSGFYNVGLEHGASNQEIINRAEVITGRQLQIKYGQRRPGDPSQLVGDCTKVRSQGWVPRYSLDDMIQHAWAWYTR
jgi:UDP-glucose 4-epimerase